MSLENQLEEMHEGIRTLTASIDKLIEALGKPTVSMTGVEEAIARKGTQPKKAKAAPVEVEYQDQDGNVTTSAEKKAKEAAAREVPADVVTSTQVAQALVALMKDKGRDAGVAVLQQFGASKVPEIVPEDYPKVLAAIKAAQ